MKRKEENGSHANGRPAKRLATSGDAKANFRSDVFDDAVLQRYTSSYAESQPYRHGVIDSLIRDDLLRAVRDEISSAISFTPKETDIYKIHQSGDLANLDGLDDSSLARLPSLITLRDSLYSQDFREYLAKLTGAGSLSGQKTDMAVNVYTPGCHLLCHDDVIGTRRVSYILYLTDPDKPWRPEWGGALRLYPTKEHSNQQGEKVKVPHHEHTLSIPPAFGQLSFFAVQPGESFHDVEEVYARGAEDSTDDGGRIRMAISGWYHIPQEGEHGYDPDAADAAAAKSSLTQLQGKADEFDAPQPLWLDPEERAVGSDPIGGADGGDDNDDEGADLTEADLTFLLQFMNPRYLVPDTVLALRDTFDTDCSLRLALFLSDKFATALRKQVEGLEAAGNASTAQAPWSTATPPHKHRYLFRQPSRGPPATDLLADPYAALLSTLFPSLAFRKWLVLATGFALAECNVLARRFRRGADYTLATNYDAYEPQLEVCLGATPTLGWGADAVTADDADGTDGAADADGAGEGSSTSAAAAVPPPKPTNDEDDDDDAANVGGYEAYMAGDDEHDATDGADDGANDTTTGAGDRRGAHKPKSKAKPDPAVYQAARGADGDEDDGVLFSMPAAWNALSVVLRDAGTLRFVKYVSRAAKGDRWDVVGEWRVDEGGAGFTSDDDDDGVDGGEDNDGGDDGDDDGGDGEDED